MSRPGAGRPPIVAKLIIAGAAAWGAAYFWYLSHSEYAWAPWTLATIAFLMTARTLGPLTDAALNMLHRIEARRVSDKSGSAHWAGKALLRKEKLTTPQGLFLGKAFGRGVFFDGETHGLTLSPAGGGKTVSFCLPVLAHASLSMIVTDFKGTLSVMTARMREKHLGHETVCLNPGGLFRDQLGPSASYNPLQILIDDWEGEDSHKDLVADAQAMARQLHPDPSSSGENQYFRSGTRKLIVFVLIHLVVVCGPHRANLCEALRFLRVREILLDALRLASRSPTLGGELADMARDLLPKFEAHDTRQAETFREGAVQSLEVFSPSGHLAACVKSCTFRFRDLKKKRLTIYLISDPTRMKVFAKAYALIIWCALTELKRCQSTKPVLLLCEEASNFIVEGQIGRAHV